MKRNSRATTLLCLLAPLFALQTQSGYAAHQVWMVTALMRQIDPIHLEILRLGSDDFEQREKACAALRSRGTEAFDELYRAQHLPDFEIASSAKRLISLVDVQAELAAACSSLTDYTQVSFADRAKKIIQLGRHPTPPNCHGLVRIARYELDEFLSRRAAIEIVTANHYADTDSLLMEMFSELESSERLACRMICGFAESRTRPMMLTSIWDPLIDELVVENTRSKATPRMLCDLLRWYVEQLREYGEVQRSTQLANLIVELVPPQPRELIETIDWLKSHGFTDQCKALGHQHDEVVQSDSLLLYRMAELYEQLGDRQRAENYAQQAKNHVGSEPLIQIQTAIHLQYSGMHDWAIRQLMDARQNPAADWAAKTQACCLLAELWHYLGDDLKAAEELAKAVENLKSKREKASVQLAATNLDTATARRSYFLALHEMSEGQYEQARRHLLDGISKQPGNSDLLIAMHQLPVNQPNWRADVRQLIELALQQTQQKIELLQEPLYPQKGVSNSWQRRELAELLNRYAWLAGNTQTDLQQAEDYSRMSVEIAPRNGDYLDTLAGCLYRQGKFHQAVATQKRAVAQRPFSNRLQVTLNRYRQAIMFAELPAELPTEIR